MDHGAGELVLDGSSTSFSPASSIDRNHDTKPKLLDQVRQAIQVRHYSRRTQKAYVAWIRQFTVYHGKRHPMDLGEGEISGFLTWLAVHRKVSASTQNQALNAILLLAGQSEARFDKISVMESDTSKLLEQALRLPVEARAALAGSLIESLDKTVDEDAEAAWADEISRRISELDSGKAKTVPWSKGRRMILAR